MTNFVVQSWVAKLGAIAAIAMFSIPALAHGNEGHAHEHSEVKGRYDNAAHVHGAGDLEVVQDGNGVFISLSTPLHNLLGFEHMPKTDSERVKARRVTSLLKANGLFLFSDDAQCKRTAHKIYSEVLNPHSHGPQDDHQHHDHGSEHSDLRVAYEFECEKPAALKQIEVRVFRQFPAFEKIEVQALFPKGQIGASLTPKKNILVIQ